MKKINILLIVAAIGFATYGFVSKETAVKQESGNVVGTKKYNKAPELNYPNPEGKSISLSSLKGNIVLIDFWASWCGPCRAENPNVVAAYKKYKNTKFKKGAKGFTIYSVSLDKDKDKWIAAIQKDGLEWPNHVSDLKFWQSEGAAKYGVNSIPAGFLIDGNGLIIASGGELRGEGLESLLASLAAEK